MSLLALKLQKAGLAFISATAMHAHGGMRIDEIVCATQDDATRVDEWAAKEGYPVRARVATATELANAEDW